MKHGPGQPLPDPRTPVLVGASALSQREDEPEKALEPIDLMARALEGAAHDAGTPDLLARIDSIRVPRGFWDYADPGRMLAARIGAGSVNSQLAELGVLQTTLFGEAAADIAAGRCDVVAIAGGEARHRAQRAQKLGRDAPLAREGHNRPDRVLRPHAELMHELEIRHGLTMPVTQFSVIENALRAAEGQSLDAHRDAVAQLYAGMSRIAAQNPEAWSRTAWPAERLRGDAENRMLAFPYTRLHTSQWNVDQAAGLLLCSLETARRLGVPEDRWVFPHAVADANHMTVLTARRDLHRCRGFAAAGERALEIGRVDISDVAHLELYSCFPVAVRLQQRELGLAADRPVTQTGGMAFAGGPLNNFSLQGLARMVSILRDDPGSRGLVTAVSGLMTKQGVSLWSTEPPSAPFGFADVSDRVAAGAAVLPVRDGASGEARIASYTVLYRDGAPQRAVLLLDLPDGSRTLHSAADPELTAGLTRAEGCGRGVHVGADGEVRLRSA